MTKVMMHLQGAVAKLFGQKSLISTIIDRLLRKRRYPALAEAYADMTILDRASFLL
jgi:hypothetical protein